MHRKREEPVIKPRVATEVVSLGGVQMGACWEGGGMFGRGCEGAREGRGTGQVEELGGRVSGGGLLEVLERSGGGWWPDLESGSYEVEWTPALQIIKGAHSTCLSCLAELEAELWTGRLLAASQCSHHARAGNFSTRQARMTLTIGKVQPCGISRDRSLVKSDAFLPFDQFLPQSRKVVHS